MSCFGFFLPFCFVTHCGYRVCRTGYRGNGCVVTSSSEGFQTLIFGVVQMLGVGVGHSKKLVFDYHVDIVRGKAGAHESDSGLVGVGELICSGAFTLGKVVREVARLRVCELQ